MTVDAMEPFVKATYTLECDGPIALTAYEQISTLYSHISTAYYPNVNALARHQSEGISSREQQLLAYWCWPKQCVTPAYTYLKAKFDNDLKPTLDAFKAAHFFSPSKVVELKPTATDIDTLKSLPFCNSEAVLSDLKSEVCHPERM